MSHLSKYQNILCQLVSEAFDYIQKTRQHLHSIPELGFSEHKTSHYIKKELENMGLAVKSGIAGTGLTAMLSFPKKGPTLMIRADMDALPVEEATKLPFASAHKGRMHACGHDGHMAMLLGAAKALTMLQKMPEAGELGGSILFLFQPAEENPGGAEPMIKAGVLEGVDYCLASHIWPELPKGTVGVKNGYLMAAIDRFEITLHGRGGHGSQPHLCPDVVDGVAQLTVALQHIVSRRINPMLPAVLTIGCIQAGSTYNVIPQTAKIMGCARGFDPEVYNVWEEAIRQITEGICQTMGLTFELTLEKGHTPVNNNAFVTDLVRAAAASVLGAEKVVEAKATMAGEDFAAYQEVVPGCMFFIGSGEASSEPLHSPHFDFNEEILLDGAKVFCAAAMEILCHGQGGFPHHS